MNHAFVPEGITVHLFDFYICLILHTQHIISLLYRIQSIIIVLYLYTVVSSYN